MSFSTEDSASTRPIPASRTQRNIAPVETGQNHPIKPIESVRMIISAKTRTNLLSGLHMPCNASRLSGTRTTEQSRSPQRVMVMRTGTLDGHWKDLPLQRWCCAEILLVLDLDREPASAGSFVIAAAPQPC